MCEQLECHVRIAQRLRIAFRAEECDASETERFELTVMVAVFQAQGIAELLDGLHVML